MSKIFIAFGGCKDQNKNINKLQHFGNIELLNLEKYTILELETYLKSKGIARSYPHINTKLDGFNDVYLSWGIICNIEGINSYDNLLFLLEFYLDNFLDPVFIFYELGYRKMTYNFSDVSKNGYLNKIDIYKLDDFLRKYKGFTLYHNFINEKVTYWLKNNNYEAFRLNTAIGLYKSLKNYNSGKSLFYWEKEAMEIGIILETLFTKPDENESIGYILKKRIHYLMGNEINNIEDKIKEIYDIRSKFVHGSIFTKYKKTYTLCTDNSDNNFEYVHFNVDTLEFKNLENYITILRKILLKYYSLFIKIENGDFYDVFAKKETKDKVIKVIEKFMFEKNINEIL